MCRNYISAAGKKMQSAKVNLIFIVKFLSKPVIKLLKNQSLILYHKRILYCMFCFPTQTHQTVAGRNFWMLSFYSNHEMTLDVNM